MAVSGQGNAVDWQTRGTGDAAVTAIDGSGNVGGPVTCLVPLSPK